MTEKPVDAGSNAMIATADEREGPLVSARGLVKTFSLGRSGLWGKRRAVHAVQNVDLDIWSGETVALVGESGSGKSTIGRLLLRLLDLTAGSVDFGGDDLLAMPRRELRERRGEFQMVFQNPYAALNPRRTIGDSLARPLLVHRRATKSNVKAKVAALLDEVGLSPARNFMDRLPHELSGGQRQRVVIARALSLEPSFIVADEPLSALDVSVRAQILQLMGRLRDERRLAYLLITHDLPVARSFADRVVVLYLGKVVEVAPAEAMFTKPRHPYTMTLIDARPVIKRDAEGARRDPLLVRGEIPSPTDPPPGCQFHTRCPFVQQKLCSSVEPPLVAHADGHQAACHYAEEIAQGALVPYANRLNADGEVVPNDGRSTDPTKEI